MDNNTILVACFCLCFVYYLMGSRTRKTCQHVRANHVHVSPKLVNNFEYSPDPINRVSDMAMEGVSFDQIENNQIAFVK